jgi:hypothetical protein
MNGKIKEIKALEIDEDLLSIINETYIEGKYPGELGLLPDGMPSNEQAHNFLEYTKNIEEKIKNELNKKYLNSAGTSHNGTLALRG